MLKKQLKNLRKNIGEIWKIWQNKNAKREFLEEEIYQGDLQQENYLDGQTRDMTKNIGKDWKEIGDSGKENNQGKEKWK